MRTRNRRLAPTQVRFSFSEDGTAFTAPTAHTLAWGTEIRDDSRYAEIRLDGVTARYVRFAFTPNLADPKRNAAREMALDEIYVFGKGR